MAPDDTANRSAPHHADSEGRPGFLRPAWPEAGWVPSTHMPPPAGYGDPGLSPLFPRPDPGTLPGEDFYDHEGGRTTTDPPAPAEDR